MTDNRKTDAKRKALIRGSGRARQDRKDMEGRLMAAIKGKPPKGS